MQSALVYVINKKCTSMSNFPSQTSMFLIHTMTGVSMWCWMVASGLRYLAVYHPFLHRSRWKLGQRAIMAIVVISAMTNFWLLFSVDANDTRSKNL